MIPLFAVVGCDAAGNTSMPTAAATGIRMDQSSLKIDEGTTSRLRVLLTEAGGRTRELGVGEVTWVAADPEIATVADGLVTGVRPGTTRIAAMFGGRQAAQTDVTVLAVPGSVDFLHGGQQAGLVGQPLGEPITLRVRNRQGEPMGGVQLVLTPLGSSGSISPATVTLGTDGTAQVRWTLGTQAGPQVVEIRVAGRDALSGAITAEAAAGPVARIQVSPIDALTNPGGRVRFTATALDQFDNVVADAPIEWRVAETSVATIDASGSARALTTGETDIEAIYVPAGTTASTAQASPGQRGQGKLKSKNGTGYPIQVVDLSSPSQGSTSVTLAFTQVGDGTGMPADYEVRYAPTPMSSFANGSVARQGSCRSPIDGTAIGSTLACTVEGLEGGRSYDFQVIAFRGTIGVDAVFGPESNRVTASTLATSVPASIELIGGNNQSGAPGAALPNPLAVRVKNAYGQAMPNVSVNWTVVSGGGSVSSSQTITNSLGVAQVTWTLGSSAGQQHARAVVGSLVTDFQATAVSSSVASISVSPSWARVSPGISTQLKAEARDAQGNVLNNAVFSWYSTDASRATVSSSGLVTGIAAGTATIRAAASSVEGSAQIEVASSTAAPAWVEILGGQRQTGPAGTELPTALTVRVKADNGVPIPGVAVNWTAVKGGGATSVAQTITDAQGVTSVRWVLGSTVGTQEVRAASGTTASLFEATALEASATPRPGTVNTLAVDSTGRDRVYVRFKQVDDGTGKAAKYEVRYHVTPIGWNWWTSPVVNVGTCANLAGTEPGADLRCSVAGLQSGVTYDVQVMGYREGTNGERVYSDATSNVATGTTLADGQGSLSVSPAGATLQSIGATQQFAATARDGTGAVISNPGVTWTSSNTAIATIDGNGMLTARGMGTVVITAAAACCAAENITVVVQQNVASISVDPTSASVGRGNSTYLNATVRDANGNPITGASIAWQSSNSSIASVSSDGTVTGMAAGTATVTATSSGRTASAAVSVTDSPPPSSGQTWPNEPSSMTVIAADDWQSAGEWRNLGGTDDIWTGNGWTRKTRDVNVVNVSGLPTGTSRALEIRTPAGTIGGYGPWAYHNPETSPSMWGTGGFREVYFGYWARMAADFDGHASGSNKHANIIGRTPTGNKDSFWAMPWGSGTRSTFDLRFDASAGINVANSTGECGHTWGSATGVFKPGQWQRVELWYRKPTSTSATGHWKVWVDGVLVMERTDVCDYGFGSSSYLFGVGFHGTWGGVAGTLARDNVQHFGPFRISGRTPR